MYAMTRVICRRCGLGADERGEVMRGFALPETFETRDAVHQGHRTLILRGELDTASAGRLEAVLFDVSADGTTGITLDLSGLTFMDSTGLRAVLLAKDLTDHRGCDLSIIPGPPSVQRVFELAALLDVLPWTDAATDRGGV
jgi:anti-anti-sigma factor